jgi:Tfp pilus assembly protein PilO
MDIGWRQRYASSRNLLKKTIQTYNKRPDLKAYLELFLSLATITIFGVFAIRPTIITIGKLIIEVKAKEETVTTMNQKIENLKGAQEIYNKNIDKIEVAKMAVPDEPLPHLLDRQIEAAAADTSVDLTSLSISGVDLLGVTNTQTVQETISGLSNENTLTFSISAKGNFDSLASFIRELENLRRPIRLNEVGLGKSASQGNENILQLTLNKLSLPYLKK